MVNIVTRQPHRTHHALHLVLTFLTCGLWAPVWACVWFYNTFTFERQPPARRAWYGPVAYPYVVGPGAPVSASNPAPPTPPVATPPSAPLRAAGATVFTNGWLAFGPRCGQCENCRYGLPNCLGRDFPPGPPPQAS